MTNNKQKELTTAKLQNILGKDLKDFEQKIIPRCYCANCKSNYQSTITNYKIFLNNLDDIILKGFCKNCGHSMSRYLETGDVLKYQKIIRKIK